MRVMMVLLFVPDRRADLFMPCEYQVEELIDL